MIENRNLEKGTKLVAHYRKQDFTCEVVEVEDGKLRYRLEDGREFKSPSAAGTAITGKACNGWMFWTVYTEIPSAEDSAEQPAQTVIQEEEKPVEVKKDRHIQDAQYRNGAPKGLARWFCYECADLSNAPVGEKHAVCPNDHLKQEIDS